MALKQVLEIYEMIDSPKITGENIKDFFQTRGLRQVRVHRVQEETGYTDFIQVLIPGKHGKARKGKSRTLGVIGFLGGIGARPKVVGMVSDADGAITALAVALKLGDMQQTGNVLSGDVIVSTHICPRAPVTFHRPVPFIGFPVAVETVIRHLVDPKMDAIISVDSTRGNRVLNRKGIAISPTVKEGYILKVSDDLLQMIENATGQFPTVLPITHQDITPYGNGVYHINSIMQPSNGTTAPVVGLALTSESTIPGCSTGVSQVIDIESGTRFCVNVASAFGEGKLEFYDPKEYKILLTHYGPMKHFQRGRSR